MKRVFTYMASAALVIAAALCFSACADGDAALMRRADKLHKQIISVDTHTDSAVGVQRKQRNHPYDSLQANFEKQRDGGMDVVFYAIYKGQGRRDDSTLLALPDWVEGQITGFRKYIDERPFAAKATSVQEVRDFKKQGKVCAVMAIENGYVMGKDLSQLKRFYDLGVRYITLSHNNNNDICDAAVTTDNPKKGFRMGPEWHGLSPLGEEVVAEMNRLGIMIDISHTSDETVEDVLKLSKAPVIATHSCVRALCNHPRNLSDELIRGIAAKGGVVQVTLYDGFLSEGPAEDVCVSTYCDHVEYIRDLVGVDYVGFGSDFDGGSRLKDVDSELDIKNITVELMRRGWSDGDIAKFWGENLLRVWSQCEKVAQELAKN